ncbi:MAG: 50S ribosomal protein L1 [Gammaproteobacteria bacterium]
MAKLTKRAKAIQALLTPGKSYSFADAHALLQKIPAAKFAETVDISVNLGVDPRKSDQAIRGSVVLPNGSGRTVRIAVITSAGNVDAAKNAGADLVGQEDLAEQIKSGVIDFDVLLATPDSMRIVGQLGTILGPRGLMPNPKDGTVTADVATAVKNAKMGQARYRTDKGGVIHVPVGKVGFDTDKLVENFNAVMAALKKAKPTTAKGVYFKKVTLSTTMGPGLSLDIATLGL